MGHAQAWSEGWRAVRCGTVWAARVARTVPEEVVERTTGGGEGNQVFLFNCNCHTFEQVITQLLKAVPGMTRPLAEELAWRVHNSGLAEVYRGGAVDCDRVARILAETGLIVQVM
jgi:ATP-dependent Clp protease adaptor protein ClpS